MVNSDLGANMKSWQNFGARENRRKEVAPAMAKLYRSTILLELEGYEVGKVIVEEEGYWWS